MGGHVTKRSFAYYQDRAKNKIKTKSLAPFYAFPSAVSFGRSTTLLFDIQGL